MTHIIYYIILYGHSYFSRAIRWLKKRFFGNWMLKITPIYDAYLRVSRWLNVLEIDDGGRSDRDEELVTLVFSKPAVYSV